MSWRAIRCGPAILLLAGCAASSAAGTGASKLAPDSQAPASEVSVEVELLEMPAPQLDAVAAPPPPILEPRKDAEGTAGEELKPHNDKPRFRRGLTDEQGDGFKGGDSGPAPDQTIAKPPPDANHDKQVQQATSESVGGRVEPASIQEAVAKHRESFSRCLSADTKIVIEATIGSSGDVVEAHSTSSQPDDPKVRDCVVDAFKHLKLKPLGSPQPARVKFALALKRSVG